MKWAGAFALLILAGCGVGPQESAEQSAARGCLFWSTDCTRLETRPPVAPLQAERQAAPAASAPRAAALPARETLPAEDLGRVRAAHSPYARDRAGEATFDARFAGERTAPPAETIYPLPSNCSAPPPSLLRNSPGGRFAPGRNSAAATAYASAYARCGQPGTWPRPN